MFRRTKIICTIGPATASYPMLEALHAAGMDVVRLNMSHADHAGAERIIQWVRTINRKARSPIAVQVRVTDTRGFIVRDAIVFVRTTPRVTSGGNRQATAADGWLTYQLVPNGNFPQPRRGRNVQVFVKAYRTGDPPLAGVAAYRLVQFRLAR